MATGARLFTGFVNLAHYHLGNFASKRIVDGLIVRRDIGLLVHAHISSLVPGESKGLGFGNIAFSHGFTLRMDLPPVPGLGVSGINS